MDIANSHGATLTQRTRYGLDGVCDMLIRKCSPRHRKLFYIIIIYKRIKIVIFAENNSFRSYGGICWPRMPLSTPEPQYEY